MNDHSRNYYFTSESVSEGHPDKMCDRISDTILDAYLSEDKNSRVAIETLVTTNLVVISGEIRSNKKFSDNEIDALTRNTIKEIGYNFGDFNYEDVKIMINLHEQSPDIAQGVDAVGENSEGAGDQGIMFGYACNETKELMPATLFYSHKILEELTKKRKNRLIEGLLPDSKSQLTLFYENNKPKYIDSIVVSTQHTEETDQNYLFSEIEKLCKMILPNEWYREDSRLLVNPTGKFVIGGPVGDTGLTGRKIIVDTYGGAAPHGGGAFSGKDPTKVDRSAAYIARYLAKNIVASGVAPKCLIQLSYAIGVAEPLSIYVDTYGTGTKYEKKLEEILPKIVDLSPKGIIEKLGLRKPIYEKTASYGHFGRTPEVDGSFSWEKIDLVDHLAKHL